MNRRDAKHAKGFLCILCDLRAFAVVLPVLQQKLPNHLPTHQWQEKLTPADAGWVSGCVQPLNRPPEAANQGALTRGLESRAIGLTDGAAELKAPAVAVDMTATINGVVDKLIGGGGGGCR
jgi:hypothetical protein